MSTGLVPCPGTVMIFILALSKELYFIGFISALFMSLGMSFVIFIGAVLSINARSKSSNNPKLFSIFEFFALFIMFVLGTGMIVL